MKTIFTIITLLILASCGREAELISVDSQLASIPGRFSLEPGQKVNKTVREINVFSFPLTNEVSEFFHDDNAPEFNRSTWDQVFGELDFADFYKDAIPLNLPNDEKVRKTVSAILSIALARDFAWKRHVKYRRLRNKLKDSLGKNFFSKYPCYAVRKGTNKRKCYSKKLSRVTKSKAKVATSCKTLEKNLKKFKGLKDDERIPEGSRAQYILDNTGLENYKKDIAACKTQEAGNLSRYGDLAADAQTLRVDGKALVRDILKDAEVASGEKYLATTITETDLDTTGSGLTSTIDIDLETMTIREFDLAIDFHVGNAFESFNPELGNMSEPIIKRKVNQRTGETFYTLHFEMYPNGPTGNFVFSTDEKGLTIDTNSEFNLRISGKTLWTHPGGIVRDGVMKIELNYEDEK